MVWHKLLILSASLLIFTACGMAERLFNEEPGEETPVELTAEEKHKVDQLFYEAQKQKLIGNDERALQKFRELIEINPAMDVAHFEMARLYMKEGDVNRGVYHSQRARSIDRDNKWYKELYAQALAQQGNYFEAAELYSELVMEFPGKQDYAEEMADLYRNANAHEEALQAYDQLEERFGYTRLIGFQRYRIYMDAGQSDNAIVEVERLIENHPNDPRFKHLLADIYRSRGDTDEAYEVYKRILDLSPQDEQAQMSLLRYYMERGEDERSAEILNEVLANPAIEMDQKMSMVYQLFLQHGLAEEDRKQAVRSAEILREKYPDNAESHALYGDVYYQMDSLEKAKTSYLKALELEKDVYQVWQNLMFIYAEMQDYEGLLEFTAEASTYYPNHAEVFYLKGLAENRMEQYESAVSTFNRAIGLIADNPRLKSEILGHMGDAYYQLGRYSESDEQFEKALEIDPENPVVLNNYSYYLALRNERLEEARRMSAKSLELSPDNPAYLDTYGWIKFRMGEYEEARKWIGKAMEIDPESKEIIDHYGDVMYKLGEEEAAIEYWEKAHSLSDNSKEILEKIRQKTIINE